MAVSCLSPVRIQIFISAFIRVSMVSGTLSWSLSSIAVAPSSCRFYSRIFFFKKAVRGNHRKKKCLYNIMCQRNMRARSVSLIQPCFPSSAAVYHAQNPQQAFRKKECMCVCVCVCIPRRHLSYTAKAIQYSVFWFFFFFLSRNSGDSLVPVAGLYRAKTGSSIWQDPGVEGRHEPAAEEKPREAFETVTSARAAPVCSSAGPSWEKPHTARKAAPAGGTTPLDLMSSICLFWCGLFNCPRGSSKKRPFVDYDRRTTWIRVSALKPGRPRVLTPTLTGYQVKVNICF